MDARGSAADRMYEPNEKETAGKYAVDDMHLIHQQISAVAETLVLLKDRDGG